MRRCINVLVKININFLLISRCINASSGRGRFHWRSFSTKYPKYLKSVKLMLPLVLKICSYVLMKYVYIYIYIYIYIISTYIYIYNYNYISSNNKKLQISRYTVFHVLLKIFQTWYYSFQTKTFLIKTKNFL